MYTVIYLCEGGDLYYEEFASLEEARYFVENKINEHKAHIVEGKHIEDHT